MGGGLSISNIIFDASDSLIRPEDDTNNQYLSSIGTTCSVSGTDITGPGNLCYNTLYDLTIILYMTLLQYSRVCNGSWRVLHQIRYA